MPEAIKDIVVRITARKEGFESLDSATSEVKNFSNKIQDANVASLSFADRLSNSAEGFEKLGRTGVTFMSVMDRIEISQLNVANAQATLTSSQLRYTEAVQKYGENSREAFLAGNELTRAQNSVEKANMRATASMALVGVTMVSQTPAIISFGRTMVTTMRGIELSTAAMSLRLKALAPELLILSAMAGGFLYLTQRAKAAEESMSSVFETVNTKAEELKRTIDEIKNNLTSTEQRATEARVKMEATLKAISDSSLSSQDKRIKTEEVILQYNQEIRDIRLASDREALKNSENQAAIYEDIGKILEENAKADLNRQKSASEFRGLRGATASAADIGGVPVSPTATTAKALPVEFGKSPFMKEAQETKERELEVNVKEFLGKKRLNDVNASQYEIKEGGGELFKLLTQKPWKLFTGVNINDVVLPRNVNAPNRSVPINQIINISLDYEATQNVIQGEMIKLVKRGVSD